MTNELQHWGLGKGEQASNHRYKERILVGVKNGKNQYRYIYDDAKSKISSKAKQAMNTAKSTLSGARQQVQRQPAVSQRTQQTLQSTNLGSTKVNDVPESKIDRGKQAVSNFLEKVKTKVKDISEKVKQKGKEIVETIVKKREERKEKQEEARKQRKKSADERLKKQLEEKAEQEKKYKYLAKVKLPNGKYRYFYDQKSLDAHYKNNGNDTEKILLEYCGLKEGDSSPEMDAVEINERYHDGPEYQNNCYSCSLTWDLRRRGFDTDAIMDTDGADPNLIMSSYNDWTDNHKQNTAPMHPRDCAHALTQAMESEGDDTYGMIFVYWKGGQGGHVMNYQVKNGKAIIIDSQSNHVYDEKQLAALLTCSACDEFAGAVSVIRTDNLEINENMLQFVAKDY